MKYSFRFKATMRDNFSSFPPRKKISLSLFSMKPKKAKIATKARSEKEQTVTKAKKRKSRNQGCSQGCTNAERLQSL